MKRIIAKLFGKEWDAYTQSYVREGWVAERQGYMDQAYAEWQQRQVTGAPDPSRSTCLSCGLPSDDHPMPASMWRSGPDLCAVAVAKSNQKGASK